MTLMVLGTLNVSNHVFQANVLHKIRVTDVI